MKTILLIGFIVLSGWLLLDRQQKVTEIAELQSSLADAQAKSAERTAEHSTRSATNPIAHHDIARLLDPPPANAPNRPPPASSSAPRNWIQDQIDKDKRTDSLDPPKDGHGKHR